MILIYFLCVRSFAMYTMHNQIAVYPAVHIKSSFKSCLSMGFSFASNISSVYVARKQKEYFEHLPVFPCSSHPTFQQIDGMELFFVQSYCRKRQTWDWAEGAMTLLAFELVNELWWQGIGKCQHSHPSHFTDRGMVHSSQNCSKYAEACTSRLKILGDFFTSKWFHKS